jgi:pilus assembly protein CpaF
MCTLPLLAGENIGSRFVVPTVAGCVDIVVHLDSEHDGSRRVREIVSVPSRVEGEVVKLEPIFVRRGDRLRRADGHPPHADRLGRVGIDPARLLAGTDGSDGREGAA